MKGFLAFLMVVALALPALAADEVKVGEKAPNFTLTSLDGKKVSLSDYAGKVVVVGFVDTCEPCKVQAQELEKVRQQYAKNPKVAVLAIVFEDKKNTEALLKIMKPQARYPLLLDPNMTAAKSYGLWGDPQVAIVGKDGKIAFKNYITKADDLAKEVDRALR